MTASWILLACVDAAGRGAAVPHGEGAPVVAETLGDAERARSPVRLHPADGGAALPNVAPEAHPDATGFLFLHDVVHELYIEVDDDAQDDLEGDPATDVPASVTYAGMTLHDVGLGLKGTSSFRTFAQKAAFKIDFCEFVEGQTLFGARRLTLDNMVQDESMLREYFAYRLYARMGAPASRQAYARVWVNGEEYGLYSLVETPDRQLVERLWGESADGILYEGGGGADFWSGRERWFEPRWVGTPEPFEDVIAFVEALDDASGDEEMHALLEEATEWDAVLAYLAVDLASGNPDGYAWNRHNFLTWHDVRDGRWRLLPWGQDRSFGRELDPLASGAFLGRLSIECLGVEACEEELRQRILATVDAWEDPTFQAELRATAERIAPYCEADPRKEDPCMPEDLYDYLDARAVALRVWLAE